MIQPSDVYINDIGRFYVMEGVHYPSMTTVLGVNSADSIEAWKNRVGIEFAQNKVDKACDRGNKIHEMAESYLKTGHYDQTNFYFSTLFKPIKDWLDRNVTEIVHVEVPLFSKKLKVAGRCDLIAKTSDGLVVIDFKTAEKRKKVEYIKDYFLQCSGYAYCYNEIMQEELISNFHILLVDEGSMTLEVHAGNKKNYLSDLALTRIKFKEKYGV